MKQKDITVKELKDRTIAYIGTTIIVSLIISMFMFYSGENVQEPLFDVYN